MSGALLPESGNGAFPHPIAAREFGKRGTFGPSCAGLGLLSFGQFRFPAHALPALHCPAAALGGAGADKIALHVALIPTAQVSRVNWCLTVPLKSVSRRSSASTQLSICANRLSIEFKQLS